MSQYQMRSEPTAGSKFCSLSNWRRIWGEFLGTTVLMALGVSANAAYRLNGKELPVFEALSWGLALACAYHVAGGASGGHFNPSVTLGLTVVGKFKPQLVVVYIGAQLLGGFVGSSVAWLLYNNALVSQYGEGFERNPYLASVYAPELRPGVGDIALFMDSVLSSTIFLIMVNAITDERNMNIPRSLYGFLIGLTSLSTVIFCFGYNWIGGAINPARLGGRLVGWAFMSSGSADFGWRSAGLSILGSLVGALIGCAWYSFLIERNWPKLKVEDGVVFYPAQDEPPAPVGNLTSKKYNRSYLSPKQP